MEKREIIDEYYANHWDKLFNEGIQGRGSAYFHKSVEKYWKNIYPEKILEVGAGYGAHFPFLRIKNPSHSQFDALDIRVFKKNITRIDLRSGALDVTWVEGSVEALPLQDSTYNRIISTCLFHHIDEPFKAFQELRRVAIDGAEIAIVFPTDPGMLNRLVKNLYTFRRSQKVGVKFPKLINALDHRNHIFSLLQILKFVYKDDVVKIRFRPFGLGGVNFNLLAVAHIVITKKNLN